jgi:hypothetical protein
MSSNDALIALVCLTVAVAVVAQVWRSLRRDAQSRARKLHYQRASYESRPQKLEEMAGSRYDAVGPERAQAISRQAELAALATHAGGPQAENPYPRGTPEFVLWVASYHLAMTELEEVDAANGPSGGSLSGQA